jgi:hypothetical protein
VSGAEAPEVGRLITNPIQLLREAANWQAMGTYDAEGVVVNWKFVM